MPRVRTTTRANDYCRAADLEFSVSRSSRTVAPGTRESGALLRKQPASLDAATFRDGVPSEAWTDAEKNLWVWTGDYEAR